MKLGKYTEEELKVELEKLEKTSKKIIETSGYSKDARKILILEELIREQLKNENINHAASKIR